MIEQIIFLGSGGGRLTLANQVVGTGGFIIKTQGYQIWVDPGVGALVRAKQQGVIPSATDIIFVSHHHLDHSNDLNALIDAMSIGKKRKKGILISTETTINGTNTESPILLKYYRTMLKGIYAVKPGDKVKVGPLTFEALPTKHDCETIGLKLYMPNRTLVYTSNTGPMPELAEAYKGCDILIADVLRPGTEQWGTHFSSGDVIELFQKVKPKLAIISHFGKKMLRANPLQEARIIAQKSGVTVFAAREGMKIDLNTLFVS
ncbi:MAG: MBL fold metallo-hydrolase [Candidatus Nanoarchaeia archaeon]